MADSFVRDILQQWVASYKYCSNFYFSTTQT